MRCFIAVDISNSFKEEFRKIKIDASVANVTIPEDYHLTLKFLGDVKEKEIERTRKNLRNVRFKSFTLNLGRIGYFPNENYLEVAWIGITPKTRIVKLKEDIDDALMDIFDRDKRFTPHITLFRIKSVKNKNKFKELLDREYVGHWKVSSFVLYESRMENGRHKYYALEEYS